MTILKRQCDSCKNTIDIRVGQSVFNGELLWFASYSCPVCNIEIEEDGKGAAPEEIRQVLLREYGIWYLEVRESGKRALMAAKFLGAIVNLSNLEILKLRHKIPGRVMMGTQFEMIKLDRILKQNGFRSLIQKINKLETHS
ncbi:hypothetical protein CKA32_003558 [Geitlerinema sp. FC II]|nr:hypothetical protein [Geitlerinema sp. CS-897]PPT05105.1 hypothetical protein CKA32_003558 [Geitlerinema sp. FC II]